MNAPLQLPIPNLNGCTTWTSKDGSTVFVRLPPELRRPSLPDCRCTCAYCEAHPEEMPMWDTLAIAVKPSPGVRTNHAWTIHHPGPPHTGPSR